MAKGGQRRKSGSKPSAGANANDEIHSYDASTEGISKIDARPHLEGSAGTKNVFPSSTSTAISALAQAAIPIWVQTAVMIGLIFGGCCSNVFALEAIVKAEPQSGHLLTFAQFLFVAIEGLIYHFDPKSPTLLKPNTIPIHRWLIQILLYFSVSILNNYAFGYKISVPVHIILRSGGSMTTLVIGWLWGKRYSRLQVFSVLILTVGIVLSAWGDSKGAEESESSITQYLTGLVILFVAQVISAFMGLYIEGTYTKYGNNYREGLFYSHFLSLLLFIPLSRSIKSQWSRLLTSPPLDTPFLLPPFIAKVPRQVIFLIMNALTHYVCVRGVNVLASISSALTVTIVLNIRKLVSLLLSIYLFGNELNAGVFVGAVVVFSGGFLYGLESQRQKKLGRAGGAGGGGGKKVQ